MNYLSVRERRQKLQGKKTQKTNMHFFAVNCSLPDLKVKAPFPLKTQSAKLCTQILYPPNKQYFSADPERTGILVRKDGGQFFR